MKSFKEALPSLYVCTTTAGTAILANNVETIKAHCRGEIPLGADLFKFPSQAEPTFNMGEVLMDHPMFNEVTAVINLLP